MSKRNLNAYGFLNWPRMLTIFSTFTVLLTLPAAAPAEAQRTTSREVIDAYGGTPNCRLFHHRTPELDEYEKALKCVREILSGDRTPDERAVLLRHAAWLEVELENYAQAIKDIEASFETGVLTEVEKAENYYFLGRLYLGIEPPDYTKAIENLRKFIDMTDDPDPDAYFYLGQALALTGKYREAIPQAEKAIELTKESKERHYRLLLFCYSELEDYERLVPLTERMLGMFGLRDEYLSQLAAGYQALGRKKEAFHIQAFRYELDLLDSEKELVGMADLYLLYGNPYRAVRILEKEMKGGRVRRTPRNVEKLGNMFFLAREYDKALPVLREAAQMSKKGEIYFRLGVVRFEEENWPLAEEHFRRALNKGGLSSPCAAHVLLAQSLWHQDRADEALKEFRKAAETGKETCAERARQWIAYLELSELLNSKTFLTTYMREVSRKLEELPAMLADAKRVRAIAGEALEAARAALAANSGGLRKLKLAEFKRARETARRPLDDGALEDARKDRAEAEELLGLLRAEERPKDDRALMKTLDELSKRRVEALEEAGAILQEAEKIAAKAEAKAAREAGGQSGGR